MMAIWALLFLVSCSSDESDVPQGEFIYRKKGEYHFKAERSALVERESYPWEEDDKNSKFAKITKEYFRCKGSSLNPRKLEIRNSDAISYADCGGADKHSLPLINGKESVYAIQIDLLNWVQNQTHKRVVITSGHRCPEHNAYVDSSASNQLSKHLIGAEVSFYVQGLEDKPEQIIKLMQDYYLQDPFAQNDKKYTVFKRYEKNDTGVSIQPWMNHEVYLKIFKKHEGRDFDNRHPYPYISLQVRTNRTTGERVIYTWDKAYNNYLRY